MHNFYFPNPQTYYFFSWVWDNLDTETLVADALANVEKDEWFSVEGDVSKAARRVLAEAVAEILEEKANEWGMDYEVSTRTWRTDVPAKAAERKPASPLDWLFFSLLETAMAEIDFDYVAEAVLRRRSKWAPDVDIPKIL
jgi:hypothetical protein